MRARTEKGSALLVLAPTCTETLGMPATKSVDGTVPEIEVSDEVPVEVSAVEPNIIVPPVRAVPVTVSASCAPPRSRRWASEKMRGPVKAKLLSAMVQTPRPCVAAKSVAKPRASEAITPQRAEGLCPACSRYTELPYSCRRKRRDRLRRTLFLDVRVQDNVVHGDIRQITRCGFGAIRGGAAYILKSRVRAPNLR